MERRRDHSAFTRTISAPLPSSVWMAQARHGSNEWTVRSTSSGFSGSATGCRPATPRRAPRVLVVARPGVPGGGHHRLVVRDLAVADDHPVRQRAARRLVEAEAADLALREGRLVEDGGSPLAMFSISSFQCASSVRPARRSGRRGRRGGRASSARPMSGISASAILPAIASSRPRWRFVGSWPARYTPARSPAGRPAPACRKRGAFTQEYLPSSSKPVYLRLGLALVRVQRAPGRRTRRACCSPGHAFSEVAVADSLASGRKLPRSPSGM